MIDSQNTSGGIPSMNATTKLAVNSLCWIFLIITVHHPQPGLAAARSLMTSQGRSKKTTTSAKGRAEAGKPRPIILASNQPSPHIIGVGNNYVYYLANDNTGVIKVDKNGGTPVVVISGQDFIRADNIVVDETAVYYTTDSKVIKLDKNGGAPAVLAMRSGDDAHIAVDDVSVYWLSRESAGYNFELMKVDKNGGTPMSIATGFMHPTRLVVNETGVYCYDYGNETWTKVDKSGGAASPIAKFLSGSGGDGFGKILDSYLIAADATSIYYTNAIGQVNRVSKPGGEPTTLVSRQGSITNIAVDEASVYLTTAGKIKKVDKKGGVSVTLISGQDVDTIAVDREAIYWTNVSKGAVMKMAK